MKQGLEVKILYDDVGSKKVKMANFDHFKSLGGEVEAFLLLNYRY